MWGLPIMWPCSTMVELCSRAESIESEEAQLHSEGKGVQIKANRL
jgi:hypothetical protein